jgi:hypothetical protein
MVHLTSLFGENPATAHPPINVRHPYAAAWKSLSKPNTLVSGTGGDGISDNQIIIISQPVRAQYRRDLDVVKEKVFIV